MYVRYPAACRIGSHRHRLKTTKLFHSHVSVIHFGWFRSSCFYILFVSEVLHFATLKTMELLRRFTSECAIIMNALRSPHFPNGRKFDRSMFYHFFKGLTPAVYSGFDFSHLSLWSLDEDALRKSLFLATPKKRRSLELRRIRRFLPCE